MTANINDENLCSNKRKGELMSVFFYSCYLHCCVMWYVWWQQKKSVSKPVLRPTFTTLQYQCTPVFHLCLCGPDVNFSSYRVSVPLDCVYKASPGCMGKQVSLTCKAGICDRHFPGRLARQGEDEQDLQMKDLVRLDPHFRVLPSFPTTAELYTGSLNDTYHCDTLAQCVCGRSNTVCK